MNSRLKDIRKALRLTQKEFAARLGITDSGISRLEKGQRAEDGGQRMEPQSFVICPSSFGLKQIQKVSP